MTTDSSTPLADPRIRRQATFGVWVMNLVFAGIIGVNYLWHVPEVPEVDGGRTWLFAFAALVSSALMVTIVPGTVFWIAARYVKSVGTFGWIQGAFWSLLQVALYADTRVYNMFRYHFNAQVLNLMYVRGSSDAIHLGWQVWTSVLTGFFLVVLFQVWFWKLALRRAKALAEGTGRPALARPITVWGLVLLPALFLEKTIYARADLTRDRQITNLAHVFPLYARLPMDDFASRVFGVESSKPGRIEVELEGRALDYPHARPAVDPDGPRPNVLILVIDCLRRDRLNETHTPNLARFAEGSRVFADHVSGGNSTRFGLFALLYGIHGSYWFPVLNEQRSPVLIDTLDELGYEFGVFGSASMEYPEMRSTLWSRIQERVFDDFGDGPAWQRDELSAEAMSEWIEAMPEDAPPFFGFLLLDSPHQTYSHPPDVTPFTPSAIEVDYMSMTANDGPEPAMMERIVNRYDNAVYHADAALGRVLDALEATSHFDDTLVVVTGDHGEEFLECGFFGHTSAFTLQQVAVPFVMRGPGIEPGVEEGPTSHLDFAPTLLEMLGASPSGRASWCLGENLFEPRADRRRVFGAWSELGVWTPEGVIRVPLSAFEFDLELFDYDWQLIPDDLEALQAEAETLERLGAECARFLK